MRDAADIEAIRQFNRFYTRKIGLLGERLLDSEFSLTEGRVVHELAQRDGHAASEIAAELGLDAGYLSRILKRLAHKRYLARKVASADGRRRDLALTAAGRRAFTRIDARSRSDLAAMIKPLDGEQRLALTAAMHAIRQALGDAAPETAPVMIRYLRPGDIGWVVQRHGEIYFGEYGWNEEFEALVAGIAAEFVQHLDPQRERCWIVERGGRRIGCVFLVAKSRTIAKLRMLLVEPDARGLGLGRRLVDECVGFARQAGYRKIALWTQSNLDAARNIYAAAGFVRVAQESHHSFGHDLVAETWEMRL
jgi:DNA-binding MarR family transcriptional regulator/N-acetylglutamate synthase-like GNAT family acetyltransferase